MCTTLKGVAKLETITHELLHAMFPLLSEDAVTVAGRDIARCLDALGYKSTEEIEDADKS